MQFADLTGKVAVVTGAGRGIGRETALMLASQGAYLVLNDIDEEGLVETGELLSAGAGPFVPGDVSDDGCGEALAEAALDAYGRIDILVNNAGIGTAGRHVADLALDEWERVLRVDLTGVFMITRAVLPAMLRQGRGSIVMLSSVVGMVGWPGSAPYAAAKAGVIGFSRSLSQELAPNRINVNVVAPGLIDTAMSRSRGLSIARPTWPRIGVPRDVATLIAFLASDDAEFITGQVISPNGGAVI